MNWYKHNYHLINQSSNYSLLKESEMLSNRLRGEWWITDDGDALYADGDVGDMNHELYIMGMLRSKVADEFGYEYDVQMHDWDNVKRQIAEEYAGELLAELRNKKLELEGEIEDLQEALSQANNPEQKANINQMINKYTEELQKTIEAVTKAEEKVENIDYNKEEIMYDVIENSDDVDLKAEDLTLAEGQGDLRMHGMKEFGWKRMEGPHIETYTLKQKDIKAIADGVYKAYGEYSGIEEDIDDQTTFHLEVHEPRMYLEVPWYLLGSHGVTAKELQEHSKSLV